MFKSMDNKEKDLPIINRIEVDSDTQEPVIVEVPNDAIENPPTEDKVKKEKKKKTRGKQLKMRKILGFNDDKTISKRQRTFKNVCAVLFIVLVVAVLLITAYQDFFNNPEPFPSWEELSHILKNSWYFLALALLCLVLCYVFKGLKLSIMCKNTTGKWHFKTCLETGILGHYYNYVTPLAVGGQPFEIYHLSKHGVKSGAATSLPIAAYFLNQLSFVIISLISIILYKDNVLGLPVEILSGMPTFINAIAIVGLTLAIVTPATVIIFSVMPRFCSILVHFVINLASKLRLIRNPKKTTYTTLKTVIHNSNCIKKISSSPITLISTFLIAALEHLSLCSIAYFTLKAFGFDWQVSSGMEWLQIIQLCSIIYVAISFIPTPGNSGAADFSFFFLFQVGIARGLAFPAMLIWRFLSFYSFILIGFAFNTYKHKKDKKLAQLQPLE